MAPDAWHHLEGTYASAGLFRLYFYNDYSKPLTPTGFSATLSVLDAQDRTIVADLPMQRGHISNTMEAAIPTGQTSLPLRLEAQVKFSATGKPNTFDFTFPALTKEPAAPVATTTHNAASPPATMVTGVARSVAKVADTATVAPARAATAPAATPPAKAHRLPCRLARRHWMHNRGTRQIWRPWRTQSTRPLCRRRSRHSSTS